MKISFNEYGGCFEVAMTAETVQEAALLARFGINGTKEVRSIGAHAFLDGTFTAHVVIGKRRNHQSAIEKAR